LYAHMNNKRKRKKIYIFLINCGEKQKNKTKQNKRIWGRRIVSSKNDQPGLQSKTLS
jgi:hypothetical protein